MNNAFPAYLFVFLQWLSRVQIISDFHICFYIFFQRRYLAPLLSTVCVFFYYDGVCNEGTMYCIGGKG